MTVAVPSSADGAAMRAPQALPYLRTFHLVAEEQSFTRAARKLSLSQPAVSAHIRALEHAFGVPLFEIRRRRAFLTPEGEALQSYTQRIFNLVNEAELAIAATRGLERGRLNLGASPTIGAYVLPSILRSFATQYPGLRVQLSIARSEDIVGQVLANRIAVGFVEALVADMAALDVRPFAEDDLVLVAPPEHPWARAGRVTRARLRGTSILRRESGSGLRVLVDGMLEQAGVLVDTAMELGSLEALIEAVRVGVGIAWVPRIAAARRAELGQISIVDVPGVDLRRRLFLVSARGVQLSPAARAFVESVQAGLV
jgi:LysR family transcriptional regulator, low CO2-responsive transcriptional regulator